MPRSAAISSGYGAVTVAAADVDLDAENSGAGAVAVAAADIIALLLLLLRLLEDTWRTRFAALMTPHTRNDDEERYILITMAALLAAG